MKKIIFIFLTLFIIIPSSKALSKFNIAEKVPNMHIESVRDIGVHNGVPFIIRRDDNTFVYCLERPKDINENEYYNEYNYNDEMFNLTDKQLERINLLGIYGYQYKDHTDIKWYGVTQFLIWKTLYNDVYFTDTKDGNKITIYEEEINEIEKLVKNYLTLPSFANSTREFSIDTGYKIYDHNNVIDNYEVKSSNIEAYIKDNNLHVGAVKEEGAYEITLIRKNLAENDYILYGLENSQPLILPGKVNDKEVHVYIKVSGGSITVNKIDSENKKSDFATLEGAEYGVYNNGNKLIGTIKTNENGIAYIDKLPWNQRYYIKELKPSIGYKLDNKTYEIRLTRDEKSISINSYEDIIKGNLIINKYYDEFLEDGAKFEIYDINNKLIDTYETKDGIINIKLEYGEYYAVQVDGIENYNYVDKFNIKIEEEKDYIFDLYSDKKKEEVLVVEVPNTKKNDYEIFISIIFIIIGLIFVFKTKKKATN